MINATLTVELQADGEALIGVCRNGATGTAGFVGRSRLLGERTWVGDLTGSPKPVYISRSRAVALTSVLTKLDHRGHQQQRQRVPADRLHQAGLLGGGVAGTGVPGQARRRGRPGYIVNRTGSPKTLGYLLSGTEAKFWREDRFPELTGRPDAQRLRCLVSHGAAVGLALSANDAAHERLSELQDRASTPESTRTLAASSLKELQKVRDMGVADYPR